jgi:hypothetical protein
VRRKFAENSYHRSNNNILVRENSIEFRSEKKPKVATPSFAFSVPDIGIYLILTFFSQIEPTDMSWSLGDKGAIPKFLFSVTYLLGVCFMT